MRIVLFFLFLFLIQNAYAASSMSEDKEPHLNVLVTRIISPERSDSNKAEVKRFLSRVPNNLEEHARLLGEIIKRADDIDYSIARELTALDTVRAEDWLSVLRIVVGYFLTFPRVSGFGIPKIICALRNVKDPERPLFVEHNKLLLLPKMRCEQIAEIAFKLSELSSELRATKISNILRSIPASVDTNQARGGLTVKLLNEKDEGKWQSIRGCTR